jgi:apolipoprotein B
MALWYVLFSHMSASKGAVYLRVAVGSHGYKPTSTADHRVICEFSDDEKIEFEWNAGTNVDTKKVASNFPMDLSDYPRSLHVYANSLLDHRLPHTDMTFRHMGSKLIVVSMNQQAK